MLIRKYRSKSLILIMIIFFIFIISHHDLDAAEKLIQKYDRNGNIIGTERIMDQGLIIKEDWDKKVNTAPSSRGAVIVYPRSSSYYLYEDLVGFTYEDCMTAGIEAYQDYNFKRALHFFGGAGELRREKIDRLIWVYKAMYKRDDKIETIVEAINRSILNVPKNPKLYILRNCIANGEDPDLIDWETEIPKELKRLQARRDNLRIEEEKQAKELAKLNEATRKERLLKQIEMESIKAKKLREEWERDRNIIEGKWEVSFNDRRSSKAVCNISYFESNIEISNLDHVGTFKKNKLYTIALHGKSHGEMRGTINKNGQISGTTKRYKFTMRRISPSLQEKLISGNIVKDKIIFQGLHLGMDMQKAISILEKFIDKNSITVEKRFGGYSIFDSKQSVLLVTNTKRKVVLIDFGVNSNIVDKLFEPEHLSFEEVVNLLNRRFQIQMINRDNKHYFFKDKDCGFSVFPNHFIRLCEGNYFQQRGRIKYDPSGNKVIYK